MEAHNRLTVILRAGAVGVLLLVMSTQMLLAQTTSEDASISIRPQYAGVGEKITAELRTNALDLQNSLVIWSVDETIVARGIGVSEATLTLQDVHKHTLTATVTDQTGYSVKINQPIRASDVDILWEGVSYTPPGYKGRALYTEGGKVRVTALPHTDDKKTPSEFIYNWTQDGKTLVKASGLGKHSLTIDTPPFGDSFVLTVQVKNIQGEYIGGSGLRLTPTPIEVVMYEQKSLLGLWTNTDISNSHPTGADLTIRAIPYYLGIRSLSDTSAKFAWSSSNTSVTQGPRGKAVLSALKNGSRVRVVVSNKNNSLQQGTTESMVSGDSERSLFGI